MQQQYNHEYPCIYQLQTFLFFFFLLTPRPPRSTLFPYTTLFRSAISLVGKFRIVEAEAVLVQALAGDPHNPFTLNNMGYVMEQEGDLQSALRYYSSAASLHSDGTILVAPNPKWRGRSISEVAEENARAVNKEIAQGEDLDAQVARLNLRGVAAINHNDPEAALKFFQEAYKL